MNRLIIESIEGRVLAAVTMFVVIMILVGWIAINEPARMASFEKLHEGRSIERGAELFSAYCSTCHNKDGRGQPGRAPGLNNPQLFGFNFVASTNSQILRLERNIAELESEIPGAEGSILKLSKEYDDLFAEIGTADVTADRKLEIGDRIKEIDAMLAITPEAQAALDALVAERTALTTELGDTVTVATDERKAEIQARLEDIITELSPYPVALKSFTDEKDALVKEKAALTAEANEAATTEERKAEIASRVTTIDSRVAIIDAEIPKLQPDTLKFLAAKYEAQLTPLYPLRDAQLAALADPIDNKDYLPRYNALSTSPTDPIDKRFAFTDYLNQDSNRLSQVGWGGDLRQYITTTLTHGRPGSNIVWQEGGTAMVAWSQKGGGPLRDDQIEDIVNYILNFDKGDAWTLDDLYAVNQFGKLHGGGEAAPLVDTLDSLYGNNTKAAAEAVVALTGDAAHGDALYHGSAKTGANKTLGCASCHAGGSQAPSTEGTWARITGERINQSEFAGYTAEQYIVESVMAPAAYVVPPYASIMPMVFAKQLTPQDMADILAFLKTQ